MPGDAFPPEREKLVVVLHWKLTQIFNASTSGWWWWWCCCCSCCPFRLSFSIVKVSVCCVAVAAHREVLSELSQLVCGSNYPAQYSTVQCSTLRYSRFGKVLPELLEADRNKYEILLKILSSSQPPTMVNWLARLFSIFLGGINPFPWPYGDSIWQPRRTEKGIRQLPDSIRPMRDFVALCPVHLICGPF